MFGWLLSAIISIAVIAIFSIIHAKVLSVAALMKSYIIVMIYPILSLTFYPETLVLVLFYVIVVIVLPKKKKIFWKISSSFFVLAAWECISLLCLSRHIFDI